MRDRFSHVVFLASAAAAMTCCATPASAADLTASTLYFSPFRATMGPLPSELPATAPQRSTHFAALELDGLAGGIDKPVGGEGGSERNNPLPVVPLPSTVMLGAGGLLVVVARRRRSAFDAA
ncbi:MAG: hypothetical protein SFZ24_12285 [Planctomycetota bacterium]|nr:hypothetical protein [Planctomycetota bacterium]